MQAGDEALWTSPPFEPTERDGALVGRGTADTKANVMAHVGALRAWEGRPPVGVKVCIEGYEEIGSGALTGYPPTEPDRFRADALVIGDMGSIRPGFPTLTTALRGTANVTLEVRTLESGKHSGQYGGAAPDALLAVLRAVASLPTSMATNDGWAFTVTRGSGVVRRVFELLDLDQFLPLEGGAS